MTRSGSAYRLPPWMHRTTEIDSGCLGGTDGRKPEPSASSETPERFPTPTATDSQASRRETCNDGEGLPNSNPGETLCDRVRKWPTPRASEVVADEELDPGKLERPVESRLEIAVSHRRWAMPDSYEPTAEVKKRMTRRIRRTWATPSTNDANNSSLPKSQAGWGNLPGNLLDEGYAPDGYLNPYWVEWLMGWPIGWTALRPLVTARSPTKWHSHGLCLVTACADYWTAGR